MKNQFQFAKYTAHGNNFIILDNTTKRHFSEEMMREFAWYATNVNFGIGCDNLLVIEKSSPSSITKINNYRQYWKKEPNLSSAPFIFRMFEPDGSEAYSCGNGLMCIADYFYHNHDIKSTKIWTRIPTAHPFEVEIGCLDSEPGAWVNLGIPQKVPDNIVSAHSIFPCTETIDGICDLQIQLRSNDLRPYTDQKVFKIAGYLVSTGEPHLVVFIDSGLSITELKDLIFISPGESKNIDGRIEKRYSFGGWLLSQLGLYLNKQRRDLFPNGINVNFARILKNGSEILEYRTFERGINKETLSCGTGAVAVAYVANQLGLISKTPVYLWPHLARWYDRSAVLRVSETHKGWRLNANPKKVFEGIYAMSSTGKMAVDQQQYAYPSIGAVNTNPMPVSFETQ
jgi:diaminopimelate epimerase